MPDKNGILLICLCPDCNRPQKPVDCSGRHSNKASQVVYCHSILLQRYLLDACIKFLLVSHVLVLPMAAVASSKQNVGIVLDDG
jgi:hypothetical protein